MAPPHHTSTAHAHRISQESAEITFTLIWMRTLAMLFVGMLLATTAIVLGHYAFLVSRAMGICPWAV